MEHGTAWGRLNRRQFVQGAGVAGLGLLAGCGRLPGQAPPPPARVPRIGMLSTRDAAGPTNVAFRQGLHELGYVDGEHLTVEWRFPARLDQYPEVAAELVQLPVDVLVTQGSATSRAAQQASATIPIVMTNAADPVGTRLVASLARPGGNVTGLASLSVELSAKRLELLKGAIPHLLHVAMLWTPALADRAREFEETVAAARTLGIALQSVEVRDGADLETTFEAVIQGRADALFLQDNPVLDRYQPQIAAFATEHRLPAMGIRRQFVAAGSLMSYGPNYAAMVSAQ